jgi:hypothetical protein
MPDMEQITDSLRLHLSSGAGHEYERGYQAGKRRARIEVLCIVAALYAAVVLIGRFAT